MKRIGLRGACLLAPWVLLLGCNSSVPESPPEVPRLSSSPAAPASPSVSLVIANWEETERLIAAERGKVVVLDLWATW